jgi:hypothetical protein
VVTADEVLSLLHACDDIRLHAGGAVLSACTIQGELSESRRVTDEPPTRRDERAVKDVKGAMAEVDAELKGNWGKTSIFVRLDGENRTLVCQYICEAISSGRVVLDVSNLTGESWCKDKLGGAEMSKLAAYLPGVIPRPPMPPRPAPEGAPERADRKDGKGCVLM